VLCLGTMEERGEEGNFLDLPEPPGPNEVVPAPPLLQKKRRNQKRERAMDEVLLAASKRSKLDDGTVDLDARREIMWEAHRKIDPDFADTLVAKEMISQLKTSLAAQEAKQVDLGIKRVVGHVVRWRRWRGVLGTVREAAGFDHRAAPHRCLSLSPLSLSHTPTHTPTHTHTHTHTQRRRGSLPARCSLRTLVSMHRHNTPPQPHTPQPTATHLTYPPAT
jgi:hypothetical protein